jgi:hypothetical protein
MVGPLIHGGTFVNYDIDSVGAANDGIYEGSNINGAIITNNWFNNFKTSNITVAGGYNILEGNIGGSTGMTNKGIYIKANTNRIGNNYMADGVKYDSGIKNSFALWGVPKARAYRNGEQSNIPHNVSTQIQLNAESYDPGADFDVVSSYSYTAPLAGKYFISAQIRLATGSFTVNKRYILEVKKGSTVILASENTFSVNTIYPTIHICDEVTLAANDVITLNLWHDDTADSVDIFGNSDSSTFLSIEYRGTD